MASTARSEFNELRVAIQGLRRLLDQERQEAKAASRKHGGCIEAEAEINGEVLGHEFSLRLLDALMDEHDIPKEPDNAD